MRACRQRGFRTSLLPSSLLTLSFSSITCVTPYQSLPLASSRAASTTTMAESAPKMSKRILATDDPCVVKMQQMMRGKEGLLSLAQGIVHWKPPSSALEAARSAIDEDDTSLYCADDGLASLKEALTEKIKADNGLTNSAVMVTRYICMYTCMHARMYLIDMLHTHSGSNQAYTNVVLSLLDEGDVAILFRPYYFNHMMALQMVGADVEIASVHDDLQPDLAALKSRLESSADKPVKMVTISNPGNPTGVMLPPQTVEKLADMCRKHGTWLIMDNAYEYFSYENQVCVCIIRSLSLHIYAYIYI